MTSNRTAPAGQAWRAVYAQLLAAIALLLALQQVAVASPVPSVAVNDATFLDIGAHLVHTIDSNATWDADQLAQNLEAVQWQQHEGDSPNLGLQEAPVWFALRLEPSQSISRLLEISYPALDSVDIYLYRNGSRIQSLITGDHQPFSSRPIAHRHFVAPLELTAGQPHVLLIRVHTEGALQVPTSLWEPHAFYAADQSVLAAHLIFTGLMLALAAYNLLLFFSIRDPAYLWYVATVIGTLLVQLGIRGISYQFLWPDAPRFNEISLPAVIAINVIAAFVFAERFLHIRQSWPRVSALVRGFAWIHVVLLGYALFASYSSSIRILILSSFVSALSMFAIGVYLWSKKEVLARFYVLAWSFFLIGNILHTMSKAGILPYLPIFEYAVQIGASLEVLLLSLALAYRINLERKKRQDAQAEALQVQQEANEKLEARVQERTAELEQAYKQLKQTSQLDGLTQVKNRQFFDKTLANEWRRTSREIQHLSLIMVDADHFKQINDTWGHPCGDACLQHLAATLQNAVQRAGDVVARYGGEEFVLLLPATSLEGAGCLAERIRSEIHAQGFEWQGQQLPLSVSIGVAGCLPTREGSFESLIQHADQALYRAKAAGRNQVMVYREDKAGGSEIVRYSSAYAG